MNTQRERERERHTHSLSHTHTHTHTHTRAHTIHNYEYVQSVMVLVHVLIHQYINYEVATISRLLQNIDLVCRI